MVSQNKENYDLFYKDSNSALSGEQFLQSPFGYVLSLYQGMDLQSKALSQDCPNRDPCSQKKNDLSSEYPDHDPLLRHSHLAGVTISALSLPAADPGAARPLGALTLISCAFCGYLIFVASLVPGRRGLIPLPGAMGEGREFYRKLKQFALEKIVKCDKMKQGYHNIFSRIANKI